MDRDELMSVADTGFCDMIPQSHNDADVAAPASADAADARRGPRLARLAPEPSAVDLARVVEALLVASDAPLSAAKLAEMAGLSSSADAARLVDELNTHYDAAGLSFRVERIARGYQLLTRSEFHPWLARLDKHRAATRISPAAMETLAIVAYKQPIIRADIDAIRGVSSGETLNRLKEMGLVRVEGRAEIVGRPILYGTTKRFLDVFGLADLNDLPPMESFVAKRAATPQPAPEAGPEAPADAAPPRAAAGF